MSDKINGAIVRSILVPRAKECQPITSDFEQGCDF